VPIKHSGACVTARAHRMSNKQFGYADHGLFDLKSLLKCAVSKTIIYAQDDVK